jgi:hypothetical protein
MYGKPVEFAEIYGNVVPLNVQDFKAEWLLYVVPDLTLQILCFLPTHYIYVSYVSHNK